MKNGKDTGIDPFMASFPELLDVGIMGYCRHGQSGLCIKAGIECYQDGLHQRKPNMSLQDFENIAFQCKQQTYQFALGGCGDPDQHEHFQEILEICEHVGIVPNYTTSGFGITKERAQLCKKYCGAVAVSWYRSEYTRRAIDLLVRAGVKTFKFIQCTEYISLAEWAECTDSFDNLYALSEFFQLPVDAMIVGNRKYHMLLFDEPVFIRLYAYYWNNAAYLG